MTDEQFNEEFEGATTMIYNLGMRLFRNNSDDAKSFSQEIYLRAHAKRNSFEGRSEKVTHGCAH